MKKIWPLKYPKKLKLQKIYSRSGIESRHSVLKEFGKEDHPDNLLFHPSNLYNPATVSQRMNLFERFAADLCEEAVLNCLKKLPSLQKQQITHLITFSCTGMYAPGLDMQLVEKLGLNRNVERTCINDNLEPWAGYWRDVKDELSKAGYEFR